MKENLCLGCEHVWYGTGYTDHCPECGSDRIESEDYLLPEDEIIPDEI